MATDEQIVAEQRAKQAKFEAAVRQMQKHIKKNADGTFELTARDAREAGVGDEEFRKLRGSLETTNEHIKVGRVKGSEVRG